MHAAPLPENFAALAHAAADAGDEETSLEAIYHAVAPGPPSEETGERLKALGNYDVASVAATSA